MRIVIGDDSTLFREGLAALLTDCGMTVVGRAADAPSLVAEVELTSPDLAIVDVRMPPENRDDGARAALQLRGGGSGVPILLLSQHIETRHTVQLVASGGFGYLLKDRVLDVEEFLDALRRVAAGGSALDPQVVTALIGGTREHDPLAVLSPRERTVLALLAEGRTNAGIARELWLTERTVESHVAATMAKLGLPTGRESHRRVLATLEFLRARADLAVG